MTIRQRTIVDATLIAAPSSTKIREGMRDPEIYQTKKFNHWHRRCAEGYAYGMLVRAGVDNDSGLIHSVVVTADNVPDLIPAAELLHGYEDFAYRDAGYQRFAKRTEIAGTTTDFRVAMRPGKRRALSDTPEGCNSPALVNTVSDLPEASVRAVMNCCSLAIGLRQFSVDCRRSRF